MTAAARNDGEGRQTGNGPLRRLKVVEFGGIGPAPHACMLLSDMGADIVRIDRAGAPKPDPADASNRGRIGRLTLDLKAPEAVETALSLLDLADVLIEGFRPGVMERNGLGPDIVMARNPALVYARMTGWGQDGPLAGDAGHDINYLSLCGTLAVIGPAGGKPVPPLNLVGDYGGGSLYLVMGVLAALLERTGSGRGQVIDAAICDGVASLMAMPYALMRSSALEGREERGTNVGDGGRFFYNCYACADGHFVSVGAFEPQFYRELVDAMGVADDPLFAEQRLRFEGSREQIDRAEEIFRTRTRAEWCEIFKGRDACFTPVLAPSEAAAHPHNRHRAILKEVDGVLQPAPAPRFSRTPGAVRDVAEPLSEPDMIVRQWTSVA